MKRQSFLEHLGWTGSGIAWSLGATGTLVAGTAAVAEAGPKPFSFVQISDSHIGFARPENADVAATLAQTIANINALPDPPAFVVHTGDVTHLAKPAQFDTAKQILATLNVPLIVLPGEHDVIGSSDAYFAAFANREAPKGWFAFDRAGIHFLSLVNVFNFEIDGKLGDEQLAFVENDLKSRPATTPIVVFAHVPMFALYPAWGWTTEDGARVMAALARFDHVTVLNGHVHQIQTSLEGNVTFATAASTAYPQPAPGTAPKPGPLLVPAAELLSHLGYRSVTVAGGGAATLADRPLG